MPPDELFGAAGSGLSTVQQIKLLAAWAPILPLLQAVALAPSNQGKAIAMVDVAKWLALKTSTPVDDAVLEHMKATLSTPEAGKTIDFLAALIGAIK